MGSKQIAHIACALIEICAFKVQTLRAYKGARGVICLRIGTAPTLELVKCVAFAKGIATPQVVLIPCVAHSAVAFRVRTQYKIRVSVIGKRQVHLSQRFPCAANKRTVIHFMRYLPIKAIYLRKLVFQNVFARKASYRRRQKALHAFARLLCCSVFCYNMRGKMQNINGVCFQFCIKGSKSPRRKGVILVRKQHVFATRSQNTTAARLQGAAVLRMVNQFYARLICKQSVKRNA